ncbi:MAG TPA: DUF1858 domain-containing protein [Clostridiaceae bacterium]|nr:DUF1858 domain-containing protein [Clostridiaceae bacterium]
MIVTRETMILDLLQQHSDTAAVLMDHGLHCLGCMLASYENLEQACMAHGIDVDRLVEDLNLFLEGQEEKE